MVTSSLQLKSQSFQIKGAFREDLLVFTAAKVSEGLSRITEVRLEFVTQDTAFKPDDILGTRMALIMSEAQRYVGVCISVEDLGTIAGYNRFAAELRPWFWFMTLGSENRIFQSLKTPEILAKVFGDAGFTDVTQRLGTGYEAREYCVQYQESNFDFVSRLMEEEGIYYYFDHSGEIEKLVLADAVSSHNVAGSFKFKNRVEKTRTEIDTVFEWAGRKAVVPGKVSLFDYNFKVPKVPLGVTSIVASGKHSHKSYEHYRASGHYEEAAKGKARGEVEILGYAHESERVVGRSTAAGMRAGSLFNLEHEDEPAQNGKYLVISATHWMQSEPDGLKDPMVDVQVVTPLEFPEGASVFECQFEVALSSRQFRPPKVTPWPALPGIQTAVVTGPANEEIHTDEYGRIKVQFHWDRVGKKNENTTCWVRSVMPWGGSKWGWFHIPRIGMEVVIQFERGNVDRPYCTGVIYNADNMPPYTQPANMTKTTLRTNSTKGGGGHHEISLEDKKGAEEFFLQSERDYREVIKNNAVITIGIEHMDKGDLTQTIYRHKTETLQTGNHTFTVESGNEITTISNDQTEDIGHDRKVVIGNDLTEDVGLDATYTVGNNRTVEVSANSEHSVGGNQTDEVGGNLSLAVGADQSVEIGGSAELAVSGDVTEDIGGTLEITATSEIKLMVGGSTLSITSSSISLESPEINIKGKKISVSADAMMAMKAGGMFDIKADGMITLKGAMIKAN